jgi:uncharacterized membrane protein YdbT with pleckstrin-like domain
MRFIQKTIPSNETVEMVISFHWTHTLIATLYLVFLGWIFIGFLIFISMLIEKWTTERALTSRRLIVKIGLIRRSTEEISCNRIEEVNLNQSIFQRILGCGDIKVTGVGSGEIILKNIDNPLEVQRKINELRQWKI